MKNTYSIFYALLMLLLASCSRQNFTPISQVSDDSYWTEADDERTPRKNIEELEPWNNKKENRSEPTPSRYNNQSEPAPSSSYNSYEDERGRNARQAWDAQRNSEQAQSSSSNSQTYTQENDSRAQEDDREMERNARRFGSNRTYYYDDPYYQVLSPSWGWTSLYSPVVRPGFYNWAPGWNVGLSWNSFNGFGMGMGMQYGYGYGYNPFFYDPWMYGGRWGMGFHNPWYMPYYNPYAPWGYNPWYNPYRFGYGYGGFYDPWGYRNHHHYGVGRGDVITNRPLMQPRNSMGSSIPSAVGSNRPNNQIFDGRSVRDNRPSPSQNNSGNVATPNARPEGNIRYAPDRPAGGNAPTTRPGGELRPDESGRPVYVSPNNNNPIRNAEPLPTQSNRPGGELRDGGDGRPVYIPPSRNRYDGIESRPSYDNNRPSRSYDGGGMDRNPGGSRPTYDSPRNRGGNGGFSTPPPSQQTPSRPSYSAPAPSRPSYSEPMPSRPSYSAPSPSSRPAQSAPSSRPPSGGGGMRPR